jgi:phosphatidate cytidylyltransferase
MIKQRVITATASLIILLSAIWFGNPWFLTLIAALCIIGCIEFYRMTSNTPKKNLNIFGIIWASLLVIRAGLPSHFFTVSDFQITTILLISAIAIPAIYLALNHPRKDILYNWVWSVAPIFYLGWTLSHYVMLRDMPQGKLWILLALLPAFACDTSAFFAGRAWGKRKLAPNISPNKTKEGALGGLLGAIAASLLVAFIFREAGTDFPLSYRGAVIIGCFTGIVGQAGDLVESQIKRTAGVKDSGTLLPGHGGILDRIDSIVFTGIVVYYYVLWFTG